MKFIQKFLYKFLKIKSEREQGGNSFPLYLFPLPFRPSDFLIPFGKVLKIMAEKFEELGSKENMENTKEKLLSLEKEGRFVFHGSAIKVDALEPRQPYNRNEKTGEMEKHGEPCVAATPFAEVAIFMAVVNQNNVGVNFTSGFGMGKEGKIELRASKETLEKGKDKKGYVYVFEKCQFKTL